MDVDVDAVDAVVGMRLTEVLGTLMEASVKLSTKASKHLPSSTSKELPVPERVDFPENPPLEMPESRLTVRSIGSAVPEGSGS